MASKGGGRAHGGGPRDRTLSIGKAGRFGGQEPAQGKSQGGQAWAVRCLGLLNDPFLESSLFQTTFRVL